MANGHTDAPFYPIHTVWEETYFVVQRTNKAVATETLLLQMAVSTLFSKGAGDDFNDIIERMTDG